MEESKTWNLIYFIQQLTINVTISQEVVWFKVGSFSTSQKEADTRMFLHVKHSLQYSQENFIIINCPDMDVFILSLMVSEKIVVNIHFKTGNNNKTNDSPSIMKKAFYLI